MIFHKNYKYTTTFQWLSLFAQLLDVHKLTLNTSLGGHSWVTKRCACHWKIILYKSAIFVKNCVLIYLVTNWKFNVLTLVLFCSMIEQEHFFSPLHLSFRTYLGCFECSLISSKFRLVTSLRNILTRLMAYIFVSVTSYCTLSSFVRRTKETLNRNPFLLKVWVQNAMR